MENMSKRLKKIFIAIAVMMAALICRMAYIQIIGGEELAAATRIQSLISLEGSNTRGMIYDRNGERLVADTKRYIYIMKPEDVDDDAKELLRKIDAGRVNGDGQGYIVYSSEDYDKSTGKKLIEDHGAYILQASSRYSDEQTAAHFIGYVNSKDTSGAAGLELMYDDILSGYNRHLYAVADVKGNILPGRGLIVTTDGEKDSYVDSGIRTTIDKEMQQAVEDIINKVEKNCAVVVLDCDSGGVTAMACTPGFDPNDVESYIDGKGDELINKATQGEYPPGSIFKIIVAAAALENGVDPDLVMECRGGVALGGLDISCRTGGDGGHGAISFEDAFAKSCNSFFIKLGQMTGADKIAEMAEAFCLGEKALDGYPQESSGHVMTESERQGDAIGNLSIGQGEMLVTPVQVARMTNIIAEGGIDRGVHILVEDEPDDHQVISEKTAFIIGNMMEKTVISGTAQGLDLVDDSGEAEASVKTGTAEFVQDGSMGTHGWMTGYTPCREPEYVITVFVEGGASGSGSAGPVFRDIIQYLQESGSYSKPALA